MNRRDKQYWLELQERYFEALTNDEEEQQLKAFTARTNDTDFDELRDVMGYSAAATARMPQKTLQKPKVWLRYAAAVALLCGIVWAVNPWSNSHEDCVAYVNGKALYDEASVLALMQSTACEVMNTDEEMAIDLLQDMFETIKIE